MRGESTMDTLHLQYNISGSASSFEGTIHNMRSVAFDFEMWLRPAAESQTRANCVRQVALELMSQEVSQAAKRANF